MALQCESTEQLSMGDWDKRMDDAAPTNRPLVSIIIPVYNVEDYVRHTLDSVLNQGLGLGQIEVIAVDDGSTDDSGRILDAYAAQYDYFVVDRKSTRLNSSH